MENKNLQTPAQIQNAYTYNRKEYKPLEKKDIIFVLLFLISTFLVVDFALFHYISTGFFISYVIFFVISTAYIHKKQEKVPLFSMTCGALSVITSFTYVLYDDDLMMFFNMVLIGVLYSLYCIGISEGMGKNAGSFKLLIDDFKSVVINPLSNYSNIFGSAKVSAKKNKKSFGGVLGFVLAIPVICVVIPLLSKSDAAFEGLVTSIIKNIGQYLIELVIAVVLLGYVYPFAFAHRHYETISKSKTTVKKCFPVSVCVSFLSAISIVYVAYLFSQLAYFFSAFKGILPSNYEYSASVFARRGFYEMFAVCVINIAIVSIVSMFVKKKAVVIKLLSSFFSLFSILLIVVAMKKMELNISIFGLSKNRILVSVFMLMALVVILFFMIHIFAPKVKYMKPIIIICSVMFIALSYLNMDYQVAKFNINGYENGTLASLDVNNISDSGDSAVPELVKLCSSKNDEISSTAKRLVMDKAYYQFGDYFKVSKNFKSMKYIAKNDFRSYNKAREDAAKSITEYYDSLTPQQQEYLLTYYKYHDMGYYDEGQDCYYYYDTENNNWICHYDKDTGAYTEMEKENIE